MVPTRNAATLLRNMLRPESDAHRNTRSVLGVLRVAGADFEAKSERHEKACSGCCCGCSPKGWRQNTACTYEHGSDAS